MKRNKIVAVVLSMALLVSMLAGCTHSSSSDESTVEETELEETADVTEESETSAGLEESEDPTDESTEASEETSETDETTEESTETEESETEASEETTETSEETDATSTDTTNEASTLYLGGDIEELRTTLINDGYELSEDVDLLVSFFENPEGVIDAFSGVSTQDFSFYFALKFDTVEHARSLYEYMCSEVDMTYITENGNDAAYFREPQGGYNIVYINEVETSVVVAMLNVY